MNPDVSDALENQNDSHNMSYSNSPSAGVPKENTPKETQKEPTQVDDVQVNSPSLAETSCLQTIGAGKVDQLNPEGSSLQLGMGQCSPSVASPQKLRLKSDHEKELAEVIAKMNRKYEAKCQDAEAAFQSKRVEIDTSLKKVVHNKMLADAYRGNLPWGVPLHYHLLKAQESPTAVSSNSSPVCKSFLKQMYQAAITFWQIANNQTKWWFAKKVSPPGFYFPL
nr:helicase protein MOM1-like isoform X1 [Tanacetum cinerariifolium]